MGVRRCTTSQGDMSAIIWTPWGNLPAFPLSPDGTPDGLATGADRKAIVIDLPRWRCRAAIHPAVAFAGANDE